MTTDTTGQPERLTESDSDIAKLIESWESFITATEAEGRNVARMQLVSMYRFVCIARDLIATRAELRRLEGARDAANAMADYIATETFVVRDDPDFGECILMSIGSKRRLTNLAYVVLGMQPDDDDALAATASTEEEGT
jgi:hypothetical protein